MVGAVPFVPFDAFVVSAIDPKHCTGLQKPVSGSQRGWNQVLGWPARLAAIAFFNRSRSHCDSTGHTPLHACSLWKRFFDWQNTPRGNVTGTHLFSRGLKRHRVILSSSLLSAPDSATCKQL